MMEPKFHYSVRKSSNIFLYQSHINPVYAHHCKYYPTIYTVIQEESAILWDIIVCVILIKKVHINMCPIFDGYGVMGIF
jgi:putative component of membrane protein insertase Oxa1/YidC/SpoIIIJ protein YidD